MDHAYFSATRLYQELIEVHGADAFSDAHLDVLTAIMLHNSLFKFAIAFYKSDEKRKAPLKADLHPLAYLLMLCDELQCWDRTAYGRNSRTELHPMDAEFDFGRGMIHALYCFDAEESEKIGVYEARYRAWEQNDCSETPPRLKAYSDMAEKEQRFRTDIEKLRSTDAIGMKAKRIRSTRMCSNGILTNFLSNTSSATSIRSRASRNT